MKLLNIQTGHNDTVGLINASSMLHRYLLVATPEQALIKLERSGLQNLALGPFLISKR